MRFSHNGKFWIVARYEYGWRYEVGYIRGRDVERAPAYWKPARYIVFSEKQRTRFQRKHGISVPCVVRNT